MSSRKPPTSTPAGSASTAKPAEFEKSATSATTAAAAGAAATASTAVKPGSPAATAAKESPKTATVASSKVESAKTEPSKPAAGAGKAVKATENQGRPAEAKPEEPSKTAAVASSKVEPAKMEPTKPAAGAGKAVKATENQGKPAEAKPEEPSKSKPVASSKVEPSKTETTKPAAGVGKAAKATENQRKPADVKPAEPSKGAPKSPTKPAGAADKKAKPEDVKPKVISETKPSSPTKVDPTAATVVDGAAKGAGAAAPKGKTSPTKTATSAKEPDMDPFDALACSLPTEEVLPKELVYTGPEVKERDVTKKKGVLCGEDERTLPPEHRFEDTGKNIPPGAPEAKPEKPMSQDDALSALSLGFDSGPTPCAGKKEPKVEEVCAIDALSAGFSKSAPPSSAPKKEEVVAASVSAAGPLKSAAPPADKKAKLGGDEFSLTSAVESPKPRADKKPKKDESPCPDAISALDDLLPAAEPIPEPPKIRPEDEVKVDKLKSKKAEKEGEREDTLPPDYRFTEEELKKYPAPKPEPAMSTDDALDILGGGFAAPAAAPVVQSAPPPTAVAPAKGKLAVCPGAPQLKTLPPSVKSTKKDEPDFSLGSAVEDLVAPTAAAGVHAEPKLSEGAADAMDALSNTLADITPAPAPAPLPVKDVVKEKKVVQERVIKMGERDDTLPPEFQPTEEQRKEMEKMKTEAKSKADVCPAKKAADESAALDLLSADFSSPSDASAPAVPCVPCASAVPQTQSAAPAGEEMPCQKGPVLDALSETLLPNTAGFKSAPAPAPDKPKAKSGKSKSRSKKQAVVDPAAVDVLSADLGSDVVSTSPAKKSSKS